MRTASRATKSHRALSDPPSFRTRVSGCACSVFQTFAAITAPGPSGVTATIRRSRPVRERVRRVAAAAAAARAVAPAGSFANSHAVDARPLIRAFSAAYGVELADAERGRSTIPTFNDFFTRALAPGLRPLPDGSAGAGVSGGWHSEPTRVRSTTASCCRRRAFVTSLASLLLDSRADKTFQRRLVRNDLSRAVGLPSRARTVRRHARPFRCGAGRAVLGQRENGSRRRRLFCRNERLVMHFDGRRSAGSGHDRRTDRRVASRPFSTAPPSPYLAK